jgi:hypothetical protein
MQCPFCMDNDFGWHPATLLMHVEDSHRDRMYEPAEVLPVVFSARVLPGLSAKFPGVDIDAVHNHPA